jgi:predicted nucleic acid-binding protein
VSAEPAGRWQIAGTALQAGVPLATRDTRLIENADALGLDVIDV